jgi:hypothetical protein
VLCCISALEFCWCAFLRVEFWFWLSLKYAFGLKAWCSPQQFGFSSRVVLRDVEVVLEIERRWAFVNDYLARATVSASYLSLFFLGSPRVNWRPSYFINVYNKWFILWSSLSGERLIVIASLRERFLLGSPLHDFFRGFSWYVLRCFSFRRMMSNLREFPPAS